MVHRCCEPRGLSPLLRLLLLLLLIPPLLVAATATTTNRKKRPNSATGRRSCRCCCRCCSGPTPPRRLPADQKLWFTPQVLLSCASCGTSAREVREGVTHHLPLKLTLSHVMIMVRISLCRGRRYYSTRKLCTREEEYFICWVSIDKATQLHTHTHTNTLPVDVEWAHGLLIRYAVTCT